MNMIHYTSIEQSKKLIELGLDPESADMVYRWEAFVDIKNNTTPVIGIKVCDLDVPCWSASALLEVMPKKIEDKHYLMLGPAIKKNWCIAYMTQQHQYHPETADLIIDACYNMIEWLFKNDYIKKR